MHASLLLECPLSDDAVAAVLASISSLAAQPLHCFESFTVDAPILSTCSAFRHLAPPATQPRARAVVSAAISSDELPAESLLNGTDFPTSFAFVGPLPPPPPNAAPTLALISRPLNIGDPTSAEMKAANVLPTALSPFLVDGLCAAVPPFLPRVEVAAEHTLVRPGRGSAGADASLQGSLASVAAAEALVLGAPGVRKPAAAVPTHAVAARSGAASGPRRPSQAGGVAEGADGHDMRRVIPTAQ
eukprot:TRINITY_DN35881_c0_g1_i1.p1 TRINITY_DN35881_c0_g1~~TRINITY_DN35881_c0_g1_i1.p1  ORF type:complete len:244 (+),score=8.31 TRINITY_DN35881_c0_g1_i1:148-879(+)